MLALAPRYKLAPSFSPKLCFPSGAMLASVLRYKLLLPSKKLFAVWGNAGIGPR